MLSLWRLTRNRYGRRLYDAMDAVGLKASKMDLYARETDGGAARADRSDVALRRDVLVAGLRRRC